MNHYQFSNVEITGQFIYANVYKDNNYVMNIGAEILHLEYTHDIEDSLYNEFSEFALNLLNFNAAQQQWSTNIIDLCQSIHQYASIDNPKFAALVRKFVHNT